MIHKKILVLFLLFFSISLYSFCGDTIKEENYIKFKYNGIDYSDCSVGFSIHTAKECIIGSSKVAINKIFGIIISIEVDEGKIYPIFNSTFLKTIPDIWVRFDGDSSIKKTYENTKKIGELRITEKTNSRLSGSFHCKLEYGEITDGEFSITNYAIKL